MKTIHEILKLVEIEYLRVVGDGEHNSRYSGLCFCINKLTRNGVLNEAERGEILDLLKKTQPRKWKHFMGKSKKEPKYSYLWDPDLTRPRKAWLRRQIRKTKP